MFYGQKSAKASWTFCIKPATSLSHLSTWPKALRNNMEMGTCCFFCALIPKNPKTKPHPKNPILSTYPGRYFRNYYVRNFWFESGSSGKLVITGGGGK